MLKASCYPKKEFRCLWESSGPHPLITWLPLILVPLAIWPLIITICDGYLHQDREVIQRLFIKSQLQWKEKECVLYVLKNAWRICHHGSFVHYLNENPVFNRWCFEHRCERGHQQIIVLTFFPWHSFSPLLFPNFGNQPLLYLLQMSHYTRSSHRWVFQSLLVEPFLKFCIFVKWVPDSLWEPWMVFSRGWVYSLMSRSRALAEKRMRFKKQ